MRKDTNGSDRSIPSNNLPKSPSNSSLYCRIHDEEINWICFHKEGNSDILCDHNLLCLYCRKEHDKSHLDKIESIDYLKTDSLKKIIKKESDKIQNAKNLKVRLLELKAKINKLIDSKLESLNIINENYELDKCLEKLETINKKLSNQKINEINRNDILFFDETLNLIYSLKQDNCIINQDNNKISNSNKIGNKNNNGSTNSNSPVNNLNSSDFIPNSPYKRSVSLINNDHHLENSFTKERKLSACPNEINFNLNNDQDNLRFSTTENLNFKNNTNLILEDLHEKINLEFDSIKRKSLIQFNFPAEKFLWDESILAENTSINKETDIIIIKKSDIHNAAKSKQEFISGFFSSKILIEEMSCCGGVGVGFDKFNPNGRRDVLSNNYIYFSDGKIAGNIKVENLPKFKEGDVITIFCNIDLKEITFFLNSKSVYTIKNAEFNKKEVYVLGDLDGGKLKFIS